MLVRNKAVIRNRSEFFQMGMQDRHEDRWNRHRPDFIGRLPFQALVIVSLAAVGVPLARLGTVLDDGDQTLTFLGQMAIDVAWRDRFAGPHSTYRRTWP